MRIYDMKVNHLTNPIGFRMTRTSFSWKVEDAKGKKQTAARIQVATDEQMQEMVFDSGFDLQADSLGYLAEFELKPYTRYFWTVTVRTDCENAEEATSEVQWFETAKREDAWTGKWISCESEKNLATGRIQTQGRHPIFEKEICLTKPVKQARLYICGLGLYEAYYSSGEGRCEACFGSGDGEAILLDDALRYSELGERIGNEYLTPYSNDYNEWVQYQTFDVTKQLQAGVNYDNNKVLADGKKELFCDGATCGKLSILLGNGWYKARFGFSASEDIGFYGNEWKLIAELRLVYEDGSVETIGTDESWVVRRSNITFSNLYDGEHMDDTLPELPVESAFFCEPPKGELTERMSLPVTVHEEVAPVTLLHTPAGEEVFDMGQEFTGIFALRVHESAGTVIHIQTGEILQKGNFYNENLRSAKSEYYYVSDGNEKTIVPHFTFYGYRYVKVEGVTNLTEDDFRGLALYSDLEFTGQMETGHALVNRFIKNVQWGQKSNFVDVPTDCPQRDERMGWTGDAQVFSPTATYLSDSYAFYAKYLYDMAKEQSVLDGKVPDVVPSCGVESTACVGRCFLHYSMESLSVLWRQEHLRGSV